MYDDGPTRVGVFDFDELADHLVEQGQSTSPAALHGCLAGLLCAGGSSEPEYGLDAVARTLDIVAHGELAQALLQLHEVTAAALADEEFSFHPLLPDDEVDIAGRAEALGDWCRGFLAGYAQVSAATGAARDQLSEEGQEILRDIAAIAEAGVGEEESEEESEGSYAELVEYLRFACLNLFMDARHAADGAPAPGDTLH